MRRRWIYKGGQAVAEYDSNGLVWAKPEYYQPDTPKDVHQVMPDIAPYQSMIDGTMITSRSQHREHLKQHGCTEVGNETKYLMQPRKMQIDPKFAQSRREMLYDQVDRAMNRK